MIPKQNYKIIIEKILKSQKCLKQFCKNILIIIFDYYYILNSFLLMLLDVRKTSFLIFYIFIFLSTNDTFQDWCLQNTPKITMYIHFFMFYSF